MQETITRPEIADEEGGPEAPAELAAGHRRRRVRIIVAALGAAALATALAVTLARATAGPPAATLRGRAPAPVSIITVNWGLALFGANVIGGRRRSPRRPPKLARIAGRTHRAAAAGPGDAGAGEAGSR